MLCHLFSSICIINLVGSLCFPLTAQNMTVASSIQLYIFSPKPPTFSPNKNLKHPIKPKILPNCQISKNTHTFPQNFKQILKISKFQMGLSMNNNHSQSHYHTHKVFLFCNYILLGAASSCIFLTLSLRLVPSLCGFFLIFLHILTISGAIAGCSAASSGAGKWYAAHMVATVLTAIFQGSVSVLIFTRTGDFLGNLKSYVREEDGVVILRLCGGLCILIFCLEWVVLTLAFFLKYYDYVERDGGNVVVLGSGSAMRRSAKVGQEEDVKDWPWPFQV